MKIQVTRATRKIAGLWRSRIAVVQGGTSAGKTFSILQILVTKAYTEKNLSISVVAETVPQLKRGAMRDFKTIMKAWGHWNPERWRRGDSIYTFASGSYIEFFSADKEEKLRGGRRDILFVNEANNLDWESYNQLAMRTRKRIYIDFNPVSEFWAHTELGNEPDAAWLKLNYTDNHTLEKSLVAEIEKAKEKAKTSAYWANWWRVYGLGLVGSLQGVIFHNWKMIDALPTEARMLGRGLDFGYTNDPTALVDIYEANGVRILDEVLYGKRISNKEIARYLDKKYMCYADSAEPKSIDEIAGYNVLIKPVKKGSDSIKFGIQTMQAQTYLVTKRSTNIINEFRNYVWDTDKDGAQINKPVDAFNHAIDAIRYHEMMTILAKKVKVKSGGFVS